MTLLEAKQNLARKLSIDYTDIANNGLFSATDLTEAINLAVLRAWDLKPWDFTEGAKSTTTSSTEYYDYPDTIVTSSANILTIGGKRFRKVMFKDYLDYKESNPNGTDKIWSEYNGYIFANQSAYSVGATMDVYGKLKAPKLAADADLMPFSPVSDNNEYSGNQAVIILA